MSLVRVSADGWPDNVLLYYTTRDGGCSDAPYASYNIATHVGDRVGHVAENRRRLQTLLPEATEIAWLDQVHGARVIPADSVLAKPVAADASWTRLPGLACAIMSADCLPVMLTDRSGSLVAGIHAGWRGLAAGVIDTAVAALPVPADTLLAWLGPCIGPDAFEVGPEVLQAFLAGIDDAQGRAVIASCFVASEKSSGRLLADLRQLAILRLKQIGVHAICGERACTYRDAARFYSHRRDGVSGRIASLVLRLPTP
jgi:YfiH family protein